MSVITKFQVRRDTAANWAAANPTLAAGEVGLETDTGRSKVGSVGGALAFNSAPYVGMGEFAANVRSFGARGDGVADDTAAIQAAINSLAATGGIVFLPGGVYKVTTTINLVSSVSLIGINESYGGATAPSEKCYFDASAWADGAQACVLKGPGNCHNVRLENFEIVGPPAASLAHNAWDGVVGVYPGGFATGFTIRNVTIRGCTHGILMYYCYHGLLEHVYAVNAKTHAIALLSCGRITSIGSQWSNAGGATPFLGAANVYIEDSNYLTFMEALVDEASGNNSSILVASGTDINFYVDQIFWTANGYGLRIGNGTTNPDRVRLLNCRVSPFAGGAPVNTILIGGGTGHAFINVVTTPAGGGDIADAAADTVYLNVNGKHGFGGGLPVGKQNAPTPTVAEIKAGLVALGLFNP